MSKKTDIKLLGEAVEHHQHGRLCQAKILYGKILSADPEHADAQHLLGVIAYQQKRYEESQRLISRAIQRDPHQSAFFNNLGNTFKAMGQLDKARPCFQRAIELDPGLADAHFNLGNIHQKNHALDEAVGCYRRALAYKPDAAQIYNNLGIVFDDQGKSDDAIACYRKAIAIQPDNIDAFNNLAALYEGLNRIAEAQHVIREALAIDSKSYFARLNQAQIHYRQKQYDQALEGLRWCHRQETPDYLVARTYFLLGKVYDRLDRFDDAIGAFTAANDHIYASAASRVYQQRNQDSLAALAALRRHFNTRRVAAWQRIQPVAQSDPSQPAMAFLVGFPRSGTTLLEQVLNSHSQTLTLDEEPVFDETFKAFQGPGEALESMDTLSPETISGYRRAYRKRVQKIVGPCREAKIIVDKLPLNILYLGIIYRFFPEAKIIVALRHPMGCLLSNYMQQFRLNKMMFNFLTIAGAAKFYAMVMDLYRHYRNTLPLAFHQVRYEDMVADLESETRKLFTFLGLQWQSRVLRYYESARQK